MSQPPVSPGPQQARASSTGLETNLAGALCYLLGILTAIAFLVIEKEDREVRFHAYQSLATFGGLLVLSFAAGLVPLVGGMVVEEREGNKKDKVAEKKPTAVETHRGLGRKLPRSEKTKQPHPLKAEG